MAAENSFDVVSQYDEQELANALDQTRREVATRYDLKDTKTEITHDKQGLTILTASEFTLKTVTDVLETKLVRRGLSLKILKPGKIEQAHGGMVRQTIDSPRSGRRSRATRCASSPRAATTCKG